METLTPQQEQILAFEGEVIPANLKAAMSGAGAKSRDLWQVPLGELKVIPGFNPRVKDDAYWARVRVHADSMKENGFYQDKPLAVVVTAEGICVVDGGTRLDAAKLAASEGTPLETIPCVVKDRSASMEDLMVGMVMGNNGERFTQWEMSVVVKRLASCGWDDDAIAKKLNITTKHVDNFKRIASAPLEVRKMVQAGTVSANVALTAVNKHGAKASVVLDQALAKAKEKGKSKATAKDMPGHAKASYLKRSAVTAFEVLAKVRATPEFSSLPEVLQAEITKLLDTLPKEAN